MADRWPHGQHRDDFGQTIRPPPPPTSGSTEGSERRLRSAICIRREEQQTLEPVAPGKLFPSYSLSRLAPDHESRADKFLWGDLPPPDRCCPHRHSSHE